MTEAGRCDTCGAELDAAASPLGLCARCLLESGLREAASTTADSERTTSPSPAPAGGARPGEADASLRSPADLALLFPQLEIKELLGHGGMGAVYLARQKALDRLVALKLLAPREGSSPEFAERFTREAKALARLNHPRIVAIYDFGIVEGLYFFLMEYVDGTNLRHLMRGGHLSPAEALALVPQICDALQYAHEESVVHRDIKPENILLDKKGRVKIADFGLAKILGTDTSEVGLTGSRHVMGTPHYMAPEQLEHPKNVDHRADIYSLGVVFYEMLTGELPLGRFLPPSQKVQVDVRLDDVVLRALEKEPERRYQHVSEIKTDIGEIGPTDAKAVPAAVQQVIETKSWLPRTWRALSRQRGVYRWGVPVPRATKRPKKWTDGLLFLFSVALLLYLISRTQVSSLVFNNMTSVYFLFLIAYSTLRAAQQNEPESHAYYVLNLQSYTIVVLLGTVVRPSRSISFLYNLAATKPGPDDDLFLRILCFFLIGLLVVWKIRTWKTWKRYCAEHGLARPGRGFWIK